MEKGIHKVYFGRDPQNFLVLLIIVEVGDMGYI